MNGIVDFLLLAVVALDLSIVSTSRLTACVNACALQGAALALLPVGLWLGGSGAEGLHVAYMAAGTLALKSVAIPFLLNRAIRQANVKREAEPFVSLHLAVLMGAVLVCASFWLARLLQLPRPAPSPLLVPVSFATLFSGFLVLVCRRKAVTQVIGYLLVENGVFVFGQVLAHRMPSVIEMGILLDLLVGIFVMGIAIHHISREFDHIDTDRLESLRG